MGKEGCKTFKSRYIYIDNDSNLINMCWRLSRSGVGS